MKKNKKRTRKAFLFIKAFIRLIDKKIITPITKFILLISEKLGKRTDRFERWLVKKNTLLFISLVLAIALFIMIDNKSITLVDSYAEVLHNQKVEAIYNTETYVVEGLPETVDVTLIGRKNDMYLAKQSSKGTVTVDISNLKEGTHKVTLSYESNVNTINYKLDPSTVNITIYEKVSSTKAITIDTINKESLSAKLSVSKVSIDKTDVIIKGAEHTIKKVANVRALVDINKLVDPEVGVVELENVPLIAYDTNGKVVDVEMVPNKVTAIINIDSPHKEVPIKVIPEGEVQFGKAISSITSSVTKVTIYGSNDVISKIEYLPITIDVRNLNTNKEYNVSITAPEGIRDLSVKTTKINVSLGEELTKEIKDIRIETTNLDSNYKAAAIGESSIKTTVIVKGTKEVLNSIDETKIKAIVDLSGYKEGEHEVTIKVTGDDVKATYTPKTTKIKIRISKK
ncbi:MAG: CdaR family protein [Mycoplasmatota bacterium]|nr:CdaR family protein [Mycoplasmatota bacterium]